MRLRILLDKFILGVDWLGRVKDAFESLPWLQWIVLFIFGPSVILVQTYQVEISPFAKIALLFALTLLWIGVVHLWYVVGIGRGWAASLVRGAIPISTSEIRLLSAGRHNASPSDPDGRIDFGPVQITNLSPKRPVVLTTTLRLFTDSGVNMPLKSLCGPPNEPRYENPIRIPPDDFQKKRLAFLMDELMWPTYIKTTMKGELKAELIIEDAISGSRTVLPLPGQYRGQHA